MTNATLDNQAQNLRFLCTNDQQDIGELVGAFFTISFDSEFDAVPNSVSAMLSLLESRYDLIVMDCLHGHGDDSLLPAEVAALFQTIPVFSGSAAGKKRLTEGERLFRMLRSPEAADLGWKTDVGSVPVVFYTANPSLLDQDVIGSMPPVSVIAAPRGLDDLTDEVQRLLGEARSVE